ncbi:MAG TPA: lamin tail domain-containing protein [Pyrinomonadaceae bacterium]|jgi:hypothetical protein
MRSLVQFSRARLTAQLLGFALCLFCYGAQSGASAQAVNQYRFTSTNGAAVVPGNTPVTNFACGSVPGDDCVATVNLPFAYTFYTNSYTQANVTSNGTLQFVTANTDYGLNELCLPLLHFSYSILPHFTDLTIGGAGEGVFTSVSGTAPNRIFNIEWRASQFGKPAGSLNFEVRLYEGQTRFDIIYGTVPGNGLEATVGVQRVAAAGDPAGAFTQYECHTGGLRNGQMLVAQGVQSNSLFIEGQVVDMEGNPLPGVTINLTGAGTATTTTDATGHYLIEGLVAGSTHTITAVEGNSTFYPASRTFASYQGNQTVNFTRTVLPEAGQLLISEFRLRGPFPIGGDPATGGARDEFIEIYNNTNSTFVVNTADGSNGWAITSSNTLAPAVRYVIQRGTIIPPRGHFLVGNGSGYSLTAYASPDAFYGGDIPDNSGLALVRTATAANYELPGNILDAAGFEAETNVAYREGTGLPSMPTDNAQYSFVRKLTSGTPQDTGDNAQDFVLVSTSAAMFGGIQSILGAPGPQNSGSHLQRNATIKSSLIDTQCAGFGSPASACARVRTAQNANAQNAAFGTLLLRRKFTNVTGQKINRLRFRVVDLSTKGNEQANQADLRAISSSDVTVTDTNNQSVFLRGLTLGQSFDQPEGGGINSTLSVNSITLSTPLAPGASINVEFRLGVMTNGNFRFFANVEAVTAPVPPPAPEDGIAAPSVNTKRTAGKARRSAR